MNVKHIQKKLNEIFLGDSRKVVFWYDEKGEFYEEIKYSKIEKCTNLPIK